MKFLKIATLGVFALLLAAMVGGFLLPESVELEREIVIDKPKEEIFDYLRHLENFPEWSPWQAIDPQTQYEFPGVDGQVGARMNWSSQHPKVGKGHQVLNAMAEPSRIDLTLFFNEKSGGESWFSLVEDGAGSATRVTWGYKNNFKKNVYGRYIGLMIEDMLGPVYELGLLRLKENLEGE